MKRYGEGIKRVLNSFGPIPDFTGGAAESITKVSLMAARDQTLTKQDIEPHISPHGNLQCAGVLIYQGPTHLINTDCVFRQ